MKEDARDGEALDTLASLEFALERWDYNGERRAPEARGHRRRRGARRRRPAPRGHAPCDRAGRPGDARAALERAAGGGAPEDRTVRQQLERVYEATGAWRELSEVALADAQSSGDVAERFLLLVRAGSLLLEKVGDPAAAVAALDEARALRPKDPDCTGLLADAMTVAGRPQEAAALVDQVIGPNRARRVREFAGLHWRLARIARTVGDAAGEVRALIQALECDSQNGQVCADVSPSARWRSARRSTCHPARPPRDHSPQGDRTPMSKGLAYRVPAWARSPASKGTRSAP